jgi:hypothetical protein
MIIQEIQMFENDLSDNQFRIINFANFTEYKNEIKNQQKNMIEMYNDESIFIYKFLSSRLEKYVIHIGKVAE